MILIFSQDAETVSKIARNQANAPQAVFGPTRTAFQSVQALGAKDSLFIVAQDARNGAQWWPVIGDEATESFWTAQQALAVLKNAIPGKFAGNIYIAACSPAAPNSSVAFARAFRSELVDQKGATGKVFGHADAARGPIPQPGDRRWIEVQAA